MHVTPTLPTSDGPAFAPPRRCRPLLIEVTRGEARAIEISLRWRAAAIERRDRAEAASLRALAALIQGTADA